jgi:hypothetical protein
MRGPEVLDQEVYQLFYFDAKVAALYEDHSYGAEFASHKEKKEPKGKGDRRLKPMILLYWIAGCLWAFTNKGIADFLRWREPRSEPYRPGTINNAVRELRLRRLRRPLRKAPKMDRESLSPVLPLRLDLSQ